MTRLTTIFGQVYLTSALLTFVATFLPLWSSPDVESFDTLNLWAGAMISNTGGEIAGIGLMLALLLVTTLVLSALLVEAGRVRPGATVRVGLPVDTRGQDDHRSNATTGVSIQVPVGDPDSGPAVDLAEVRRLSREAFVAVSEGRRSDPTEPLRPLLQLLPAALTRRVAARSSAPLCLASNLGRLPATFGAPFGTEASAVVMRSVTQGADADALRERGGGISSWWSEVSGSTTLSLAGLDPDAWPDDATLLRDAVTVLGRWGIDAQPW